MEYLSKVLYKGKILLFFCPNSTKNSGKNQVLLEFGLWADSLKEEIRVIQKQYNHI